MPRFYYIHISRDVEGSIGKMKNRQIDNPADTQRYRAFVSNYNRASTSDRVRNILNMRCLPFSSLSSIGRSEKRHVEERERDISRRSDNDKEREKERVGKIGAMVSRARGIISTRPTQPMFRGIDSFLTSRKCKQ